MSLHNEIMNLPVPNDFDYSDFNNKVIAYKSGHRDARHCAAELALKYDALIDDLEHNYGKATIEIFKRQNGFPQ